MHNVTPAQACCPDLLDQGIVRIRPGNVLGDVLEQEGPFDAIHVGAAAATMPKNLVDKLKPGGRMVIPVGAPYDFQVAFPISLSTLIIELHSCIPQLFADPDCIADNEVVELYGWTEAKTALLAQLASCQP